MADPVTLESERLLLRPWRDADVEPCARMNADPEVMRYLPAPLSPEQNAAFVARVREHFAAHGFGLWAVGVRGGPDFAGFVGLSVPRFEAHFTPCVEVGWRLVREQQGRGYATEGARAALRHAFAGLGLDEVVSFTVPANRASRRVMEKLGLRRDPADDFDHPMLPEDHPLRRHVLYRLRSEDWRAATA